MARYIIQNQLTNPDDLSAFNLADYTLNKTYSQDNTLVFTRG